MRVSAHPRRQRGAALLLLATMLVLGVSTYLVVRLSRVDPRNVADQRNHNAKVLELAKKSLIGYVAMQAAQNGENNPGRLPCPESPSDAGDTANEGQAASSCDPTFPTNKNIGRLPWRTLGLDRLVDANSEPLWYVASPGWVYAGSNLVINSNTTTGQLTIDSVANSTTIALIIAPGPRMTVAAAGGCSAVTQARSAPAAGINPANYVECFNATTSTYVTTGASTSYNDQVVAITVADVMPAIEAAIAERMEREIVPVLKTVYAAGTWGIPGPLSVPPNNKPIYPFPAPFANPATSAMGGASGTPGGLLPLSHAETSPLSGTACTPGAGDPRCDPDFVAWSGVPAVSVTGGSSPSCTATATQITCKYYRTCFIFCFAGGTNNFTLNATASNVGMAMRRLNPAAPMTNVTSVTSLAATLGASGSATMSLAGRTTQQSSGLSLTGILGNALCGLLGFLEVCKEETFAVPILVFADHAFLDSTTTGNGATGWFLRNKWHELSYYAVASGHTPSILPSAPSCTTGTTCLSATNLTPAGTQRAMLILTGRSINGTGRPSATLANYLEFGNATAAYERWPVSTASTPTLKNPFNDRFVVIDTN